jgi:diguanylate cyclase (GGDEF)-like protein
MPVRSRDPDPELSASVTLRDLLGLSATDEPFVEEGRRANIARVVALWPLVAAMLAIIPAFTGIMLAFVGKGGAAISVALAASPALLCAVLPSLPARLPAFRDLRTQAINAAIAIVAAALGISLSAAIHFGPAAAAPFGPELQIALFGAVIMVALVLHPIRAATLSYAAALAVTAPVLLGFESSMVATMLVFAALCIGIVRLARQDQKQLEGRQAERETGQLATRLVGEFEAHGSGWFWQTDRHGHLTYLSTKVAHELGRLGPEPIGQRLTQVFRIDSELVDTERTLTFHLSSRTSFSDYSVRPAAENAAERWWSMSGRPVLDDLGRFQGFIGSGSDLTEKRRADAEITRLALFDGLTGLANRQRMRLSLDQTLSPGHGGRGPTGLFLLDLDRFKAVNDTLGHQTGDALLKQVAQRLQRTVGDAGLVGRLGGDEFQVVIPRENNRDTLGSLAQEVIVALSQPYFIDGSSLSIGCSVGIAISPEHGEDSETLIRNADLALYAAKADGRGVHRFFREELLAGARTRKRLEDDLRQALAADQFHLCYQPVVSTRDEHIVGYEALLRWDHPTRGPISPAEFVPVAEECGLIETIGEWVLRTACREAANWPGGTRVAVNVSPIQFANPALPAIVTSALAGSGLAPERLELEITEGVFVNESLHTQGMFATLKRLGVRLALDDFGTGYSSLGYLKKAPFDKIKIDQSFVRGAIAPGNRNAAIIKAIVTLADTLGMETTAEGVEQQDEIALIRDLGCSHIQGFVYGRPARAPAVLAQLSAEGGIAAPVGHKVSRTPRNKVLRSARLEIGEETGEVRIRNISATGAMIDGVYFPPQAIGVDVQIELLEDQLFPATIRWADDGRAGLQFVQRFDMDRLNAPAQRPGLRRAG